MFIISDRIKETSTTSGSGSLVLNGAYGAFQTFLEGVGDGATTYYTIENNSRWEVGQGIYDASTNSISRDIVFTSSASGAKINLQGVSTVFCTLPASKAFIKDPNYNVVVNDIVSSGQANISSLVVDEVSVSGISNFADTATFSGDIDVVGNANLSNVSGAFLTLVQPAATGVGDGRGFAHFHHTGSGETLTIWHGRQGGAGYTPPLDWRIGLKSTPISKASLASSPTYGYIILSDSNVGQVANSSNYFVLSPSTGFQVVHEGKSLIRGSSQTGIFVNTSNPSEPTFSVKSAILQSEDLQRWTTVNDDPISVVDSGGKFGILTPYPLYELDVNGSGRLQSVYLTSGIYFQDGTFQSTASAGSVSLIDINAISGIAVYASGLSDQNAVDIITVSGLVSSAGYDDTYVSGVAEFASGLAIQNALDIATVSGLLYDDAAISGYFESRVDTNEAQISAVSGWAQDYIDSQDHSAVSVSGWAASEISTGDAAVSGWAQAYVDSQDHSAASVSGALQPQITQNAADIIVVSGLIGDSAVANFASGLAVENEIQIAAVSGWAQNYVDSQDHSAAAVSGWASSTFITVDDDTYVSGIATYASGQAIINETQISAVSGWAVSTMDAKDAAISGWAQSYIDSQDHSAASVSGWADSTMDARDAAVSGWAQAYIDAQDHSAASVSGWAASTFITTDDDSYVSGIASFASGLAIANELEIAAVSGYAQNYVDSQDHSAIAVSGWAASTFSSSQVSGVSFLVSGVSDEYRVGTIFIDNDGTEQTVRTTSITNGYLTLEVANFSPSVYSAGQSRYWDQAVTQWTVTVDNPTDYLTNYVSGVAPYLTSITGSITSGVALYTTSGPSTTPGGGVDWNQTFTVDGDSPIYSSTSNLSGGSASATVSFLDKNGDTLSETSTISFTWQSASNAISFGNLTGNNFLQTYPTDSYSLSIYGLSNSSNASTTITTGQGSLSSSTGNGTITFTNPIHKDNNSGRTITATTTFTRPTNVTGTEYSITDTSSDSSISASFTYPSFYIFTASTSNAPTRSDIVDVDDFDAAVTELGNQVKTFANTVTLASAPQAFWFCVRSSASQPTSFQTGASSALLSDVSVVSGVIDLEPDSPPAGYVAESYNIYGITLASTTTYVKIS